MIKWEKDNNWRIPEHFTKEWVAELEYNKGKPDDQFKPYGATPGHGLEWARLITQWAVSTYEGVAEKRVVYEKKSYAENAESEKYIIVAENLYNQAPNLIRRICKTEEQIICTSVFVIKLSSVKSFFFTGLWSCHHQ